MRVYETYDVLGHTVNIEMNSTSSDLKNFHCIMVVNDKVRFSNCSFGDGETLNPEKVLKEVIEESLNYAKNPTLGKFLQNNNFNGSEQEINAGDMVFRASKNSHDWLMDNFSTQEIKELYQSIEPSLNLNSISDKVFEKSNVFGSYKQQGLEDDMSWDSFEDLQDDIPQDNDFEM